MSLSNPDDAIPAEAQLDLKGGLGGDDPTEIGSLPEKRLRKPTEKGRTFKIQALVTDMKRLKTRLTKQVKMVTSLLQAGSTELVEKEMNNME